MLVYNKQFIIQYARYEHKSECYDFFNFCTLAECSSDSCTTPKKPSLGLCMARKHVGLLVLSRPLIT